MKFQQVAASAIKLARDGFPVSEHLAGEIKSNTSMLAMDPATRPTARKVAERVEAYLDGDRDVVRRRTMAVDLVWNARAATEHTQAVWEWARSAWQAWSPHHEQVKRWLPPGLG